MHENEKNWTDRESTPLNPPLTLDSSGKTKVRQNVNHTLSPACIQRMNFHDRWELYEVPIQDLFPLPVQKDL